MKKILVAGFGDFLDKDFNSSKIFLNIIPNSTNIIKHIFNVGYFKNDFIKSIKNNDLDKIIFFGMNTDISKSRFELIAKNEMITLKNPIYRFIGTVYSHWLKLFNKNLKISKQISEDKLIILPIYKNYSNEIKLKSKVSKFKNLDISKNAENYVCNYSMYVVENYLRDNNLDIEFYFIHLPPKLSRVQEEDLLEFINH